jgi:ribosomal protein L12E/L44/L45/RPP1/RPP2
MLDVQAVDKIVRSLAAELLPGWAVTWAPCEPKDIGGNLAFVKAIPARQIARILIAPHPPGENVAESVAHELTHGVISPLVDLIEESPASIMLEEQIVERIGKFIAKHVRFRASVIGALANPRHSSQVARKRITALATRQRIAGRKQNVDPKMIEEIIAAIKEGNGEAAIELLTKLLASAAGGGAAPESQTELSGQNRNQDEPEPGAGQYREEPQQDGMMRGKGRKGALDIELARARKAADSAAKITIRARVKELRADGVEIDTKAAGELEALADIDAAEERIGWMLRGRDTAKGRARSGAITDNAQGDGAPAYKLEELVAEGINPSLAKGIIEQSKSDRAGAEAILKGARMRVSAQKNGGL